MSHTVRSLCLTIAILAAAFNVRASEQTDLLMLSQMKLTKLGYYVGAQNGQMNALTQEALKDFQSRVGLEPTGTVTPDTYRLLKQANTEAWLAAYAQTGIMPSAYYGYAASKANTYAAWAPLSGVAGATPTN